MRIGELSRQSGIGIPTIKFYLRIGLLPGGVTTARNQADYGPQHLRRLRLVDALAGVGGLAVTGTRAVLAAVDDPGAPVADVLTAVESALATRHSRAMPDRDEPVGRAVAAALDRRGAGPDGAALRERLIEACTVAGQLGVTELWQELDCYSAAADDAAACDLTVLRAHIAGAGRELDPADPVVREAVVMVAVLGAVVQSSMSGFARREALTRYLAGG